MGILIIIIIIILGVKFFYPEWFIVDRSTRYNINGLSYLGNSEFEKAKGEFKKAYKFETKSNEKKVMYLRNISLTYHGLGEFESCYYYRKESLKYCAPNSYDYYVNKGDLAILKDEITSAIKCFERAIEIDSEKLEANNSLGLIYIGDYGKDILTLKKDYIIIKRLMKFMMME